MFSLSDFLHDFHIHTCTTSIGLHERVGPNPMQMACQKSAWSTTHTNQAAHSECEIFLAKLLITMRIILMTALMGAL